VAVQIFEWKQRSSRTGAGNSVVAAGRSETNLRIVYNYIDADQSPALFLGWSLKSATQVSYCCLLQSSCQLWNGCVLLSEVCEAFHLTYDSYSGFCIEIGW